MEPATHSSAATLAHWDKKGPAAGRRPPPLEKQSRPAVDTATAAYYLNRRPQTLRTWACNEDGPLRPLRIHGRLAWPVGELKRMLGVAP